MSYHFLDASDVASPYALPNVEIYEASQCEDCDAIDPESERGGDSPECTHANLRRGFFYQFGTPGCMPDGEPCSPYASEAEALAAARDFAGYCEHGIEDCGETCEACDAESAGKLFVLANRRIGNGPAFYVDASYVRRIDAKSESEVTCWASREFAARQLTNDMKCSGWGVYTLAEAREFSPEPDAGELARAEASEDCAARDARALAQIVALLSGTEWNADTCDAIATSLRAAGFEIADHV